MSSKTARAKSKTHPLVVFEAEVARKIRQHCRTSMKAEVCGVLIGSADDDRTLIEACIPGINASQGGTHVTFTQDTWEHIYKIKDQQFPEDKIVGWYHSHPGFGVFLSEHDLFIHENFFSSPQQVAWVYDPHTDEEGCFGWVGGKTEKLNGVRFAYSQSVEASTSAGSDYGSENEAELDSMVKVGRGSGEQDREPAWVKWASQLLLGMTLVALGFGGGLFFWDRSPWAQSALHRLAEDIQQQMLQLQQACDPELRACQARLQRTPSVLTPGDQGTGSSPPASSLPQAKEPAGEKNNGKQ